MNKILNKLRSKAGESLIESLAAILIFTMASVGMFSMVTAAARINETAKQTDREYQEQMAHAEQGEESAESGVVTMTLSRGGTKEDIRVIVADVDLYGTEEGLFAYYKHVTEED
jgi:Tfp pilus assembly protein PilX